MSESGLAPRQQEITFRNPALALGTSATYMVEETEENGQILRASYTPDANITGVATNNRVIRVINRGQSGAGTAVMAELTFAAGVNGVAGDERDIPLSGTPANLECDAGDIIAVQSAINGTGLADPGGLVQITLERE